MTGTDLKSTGTDLKSTGTDLKSTETDSKWSYMDWNEQKQTRKIPERARNEVAYFYLYICNKQLETSETLKNYALCPVEYLQFKLFTPQKCKYQISIIVEIIRFVFCIKRVNHVIKIIITFDM